MALEILLRRNIEGLGNVGEVVKVRNEVRMGPVALKSSQEVRLDRLAPRSVVRGPTMFLTAPRRELVRSLIEFVRKMWPPEQET